MGNKHAEESKPSRKKTPTFLLELPLVVEAGQAPLLGAYLEAGRQFYNAVLSAGQHRPEPPMLELGEPSEINNVLFRHM